MIKKVTVFCASSSKVPEIYLKTARELASEFLKNGISLVYGGGSVGLMGELAKKMLDGNGIVTGIIPKFMIEKEWGYESATEMIIVDKMSERKQKLIEESDAIVALPGGCGTLDELMEAITLKQLGQYLKPIIIVNINGFYNSFIEFIDKMVEENFMREMHKRIWIVVDSSNKVIPAIKNAGDWDKSAIHFAAV